MAKTKTTKGTPTGNVEVIIGNAANNLKNAATAAQKVFEQLDKAVEQASKVTEDVELKTAELDKLTVEYAEKERQALLDLDMKVKENKKELVTTVLAETNQIAVDSDDYHALQSSNQAYKLDFDKQVKAEMAKLTSVLTSDFKGKEDLAKAKFDTDTAVLKADLNSAKQQADFYKSQITFLETQLTADRNARVEEAKARGNAVVNVTTAK